MKYDAKRPSLSPDSPLYSPRERERERYKKLLLPPPHINNRANEKKNKKNKKEKKKKNTKEYDTLNTSARKEPRFVVWVFLSLQFSSLKEERTLSCVCVYHHRLCWIDENDENEHRGLDDEDVVPIGRRGRKRTRRGKRDVVDVAR